MNSKIKTKIQAIEYLCDVVNKLEYSFEDILGCEALCKKYGIDLIEDITPVVSDNPYEYIFRCKLYYYYPTCYFEGNKDELSKMPDILISNKARMQIGTFYSSNKRMLPNTTKYLIDNGKNSTLTWKTLWKRMNKEFEENIKEV